MKQPELYRDGMLGDVILPYLTEDKQHFARDFYMADRMAAMAGASVAEYNTWNMGLGMRGAFGKIEHGRKPAHLFVLKPDSPDDAGVMTSPGTPDCVDENGDMWNPLGLGYVYDPMLRDMNFRVWCRAGAPKWNDLGSWAHSGMPLGYVEETWKHNSDPTKNLNQPGWPGWNPGRRGHRR